MSRPQSGAEYRFRVDETSNMTRSDLAFIVSQSTKANYRWSVGLALSERDDSRLSALPPRDLANEWTQMQRRQAAGRQSGLSITSSFELEHEVWGQPGQLEIEFGERMWNQTFDVDEGVIDPVVWDNGTATRGVSFAALDQGGNVEGEQGYLSVEERWGLAGENRSLQFLVGTTGQWAQQQTALSWYALGFQLGANFEAKLRRFAKPCSRSWDDTSKSEQESGRISRCWFAFWRGFIAGPMMETSSLLSTSVTSLCDALVVHIIGRDLVIGCRII